MNTTNSFLTLTALSFLVIGCTQGEESFSTEPGKGFGWKNMSETNDAIQREMKAADATPLTTPPAASVLPIIQNAHGQTDVTRIPEQYIKIWFAPYQDESGNLHEECVINAVMQTGQWRVPVVNAGSNA